MNTPEETPTMKNETDAAADPFGPVIYAYTRAQALEDGGQVDVSETAREAGIRFPVYLTRAVWNAYVEVPPGVHCQDEAGGFGMSCGCSPLPRAGPMARRCSSACTCGTITAARGS